MYVYMPIYIYVRITYIMYIPVLYVCNYNLIVYIHVHSV